MTFLFAWRYFRSKKSVNAINIIAWISVLAIAVGTAALIIVLSVFNGFEDIVKGLYGDFYSDIRVTPVKGKLMNLSEKQMKALTKISGLRNISFYVEEKAVLVNGDYQTIAVLKGVDDQYQLINHINNHMIRGKFVTGTSETPYLVLGAGLSNAIGADPESPFSNELVIYLPNRKAKSFTSLDAMNSYSLPSSGIFTIQQEFDDKYAFTNLGFLQYMLDLPPSSFSGIEMALQPGVSSDDFKLELSKRLGEKFTVQSRYEQNQSLYSIMEIEKWVIYGILSLILLVAAFNMIGALTMLVLEKQKDIAVLKAMGANNSLIQKIFLSEGLVLAAVGGISGMVIAFIICYLQMKFHLIRLTGNTFIIDYYPVKMNISDFLLVSFTVFLVAMLAAWIPSRKATVQFYSLKS